MQCDWARVLVLCSLFLLLDTPNFILMYLFIIYLQLDKFISFVYVNKKIFLTIYKQFSLDSKLYVSISHIVCSFSYLSKKAFI